MVSGTTSFRIWSNNKVTSTVGDVLHPLTPSRFDLYTGDPPAIFILDLAVYINIRAHLSSSYFHHVYNLKQSTGNALSPSVKPFIFLSSQTMQSKNRLNHTSRPRFDISTPCSYLSARSQRTPIRPYPFFPDKILRI